MVKGATQPGTGPHGKSERPGLDEYLSKGYLSVGDMQESAASITLEYSSADFAVSRFADALDDSMDSVRLLRSAQNWRTLFDTETGFIRPRTADGRFLAGFDPVTLMPHRVRWDQPDQMGFEEGNTWHYTWMIPHNYAGLLQMMGGNQNALPKLDSFFQKLSGWALPNFTVSNEPDFCTPYAYVWTGNAWKTQAVVDRIRRETFDDAAATRRDAVSSSVPLRRLVRNAATCAGLPSGARNVPGNLRSASTSAPRKA